ncbi:MAG: carbamoyltransferase HypF [Acidobacteriaceae bacterium]|nr:carbamoyltransferase HypF [Acidobacteriaceae bacterium]MBV9500874.1 carbamoyltransferase HypF [Acidobacteriaceae bacterium]
MGARRIRVRGVVQGVGFRPFVYRLAHANALRGWVLNQENGVEIQVEGSDADLDAFIRSLSAEHPAAAQISSLEVGQTAARGFAEFLIRESQRGGPPSARISPDLPLCDDCLAELFDAADPRYQYPYINCTNCGPRFSVAEGLPYDRSRTTMRYWPMDPLCARQYEDPLDRRFHAQPVACPACGPHYLLESADGTTHGDRASIERAAKLLRLGHIVAIKGIGGYHLSCDARNADSVRMLRERKFRKEKPFALMVKSIETARTIVDLSCEAAALLSSPPRPIVLAPAIAEFSGVAPENHELGVLLPYSPLHYLLFASGAPDLLVMTSANRSSEPIAYRDDDARKRLSGIADAYLIGERPVARRVEDSVARAGVFGPTILRRSRGYAPGAVITLPVSKPILAVGADLKNTITLVIGGQAFVSQHIGDLDHYEALAAFRETIQDFIEMYRVEWDDLLVVHDRHPEYVSASHALELPSSARIAVQHHRAHVSSVLAERQVWERRAVGISFDGTGYGDDGTIWGGEFFTGSLVSGWTRVFHLRNASLPGGDAAARFPVQCAAGFLSQVEGVPDLLGPPFHFPRRYLLSLSLLRKQLRTFQSSSAGRLFDTAAALLGFTREISFEGQAAIWLEHLAREAPPAQPYPFPIADNTLDFRPLLTALIQDRLQGRPICEIARAFHAGIAHGVLQAAQRICEANSIDLVVLSGGVFQNELLLTEIESRRKRSIEIWTNLAVPPNDGGISLGQAALAALSAQ